MLHNAEGFIGPITPALFGIFLRGPRRRALCPQNLQRRTQVIRSGVEQNEDIICTSNHTITRTPHEPVLVKEVLQHLPKQIGIVVDCTLGAGGHALEILRARPDVEQYVGIDKDNEALTLAAKRLQEYKDTVRLVRGDFAKVDILANEMGIKRGQVDVVLLDVGVSSMQVDEGRRGFSLTHDGPLDMRMDCAPDSRTPLRAADIVNMADELQLTHILKTFGEEKAAKRIARTIMASRPITTTKQLATIVAQAKHGGSGEIHSWKRIRSKTGQTRKGKMGIHPATLTFQALRIAVNGELDALEKALPKSVELLRPQGRILAISFHSLEDRIVKQGLRDLEECEEGVFVVTRKPIVASDEEIDRNRRARSAKLRVAQRVPTGVVGRDLGKRGNKYARKRDEN